MFSVQQKRDISDAVQKILRATKHPELPEVDEIQFNLHVEGEEDWSWADIRNNGAVGDPGINSYNELMASIPEDEGRKLIADAGVLAILQEQMAAVLTRLESLESHVPTQQVLDTMRSYDNRLENLEIAIRQLGHGEGQ